MAAWFSSLSSLTAAAAEGLAKVKDSMNMDKLQSEFGVADKAAAARAGLDLTYLTPRLIAMPFPSTPTSKIRSRNDAEAVSSALRASHGGGHVMVWNLSEESYDYAIFDAQVVEVAMGGLPAPPLGLTARLCMGIESWLAADEGNVAVIHCATGRGRTAVVCACALAWMGLYASPQLALDVVVKARAAALQGHEAERAERVVSPSQARCVPPRRPA
jgi:tensin